jgi:hypothetical protein
VRIGETEWNLTDNRALRRSSVLLGVCAVLFALTSLVCALSGDFESAAVPFGFCIFSAVAAFVVRGINAL